MQPKIGFYKNIYNMFCLLKKKLDRYQFREMWELSNSYIEATFYYEE